MQMPEPTPFHKKLEALVGDWSGDEVMHPSPWDPQGSTAKGYYTCRVICDGFAVVQEYEQRKDGVVCFSGHGVLGYDSQQNCYLWHWTDSMGGMPCTATKGQWNGDTIVWENDSPMGKSRYTHTFHADGKVGFKIEVSQDGALWAPMLEGLYSKQTAKAAKPAPAKKAAAKAGKKPAAKPMKKAAKPAPAKPMKQAAKKATKKATKKAPKKTGRK